MPVQVEASPKNNTVFFDSLRDLSIHTWYFLSLSCEQFKCSTHTNTPRMKFQHFAESRSLEVRGGGFNCQHYSQMGRSTINWGTLQEIRFFDWLYTEIITSNQNNSRRPAILVVVVVVSWVSWGWGDGEIWFGLVVALLLFERPVLPV